MRPHTSTKDVLDVYRGKTDLLQWWEAQPLDVRAANAHYIEELSRKVRKIRNYLEHRKDAPV